MAEPRATEQQIDDVDAVVLTAGDYEATFLTGLGMVGTSLRWHGREHVHFAGVERYRSGHQTGIPLLHPWANRLSRFTYEVDGLWVDFDALPPVHTTDGLPIHGTMTAAEGWRTEAVLADASRALLQARYVFGEHPDHLRSFPFPHELVVFAELSEFGLRITTSVNNTGVRPVPVSFGWHPYLTIPGARRDQLTVGLPDREHCELDLRKLPTGERRHEAAALIDLGDGLGGVAFDDAYRLAPGDRGTVMSVQAPNTDGGVHCLSVDLDDQYTVAQVYSPNGESYVALEPMTAPIDALVSGDHRIVHPGEVASATFAIRIQDVAAPTGDGRPDVDRHDVDRPDVDRPDVDRPDVDRPDVDRPDEKEGTRP